MKIQELRDKTDHELDTLLAQARQAVRDDRFKVATKQLKNVRGIRAQRRMIARILTLMHIKKQS
ncbi:50S ribosomal protein L29 [Candidatus Uhrbacteria bacterium]|nr:50S ribosomal protein L29 [Candidatus Uhrbacteria bacterium]